MHKDSGITSGLELQYIVHFGVDLCSFTLRWLTADPLRSNMQVLECSCARE